MLNFSFALQLFPRLSPKRFTNLVESVARVSLILAMALPHTAFIGAYVALKFLFPSFVKWLAYDTYTTALISIWYPLIMTLSWVHEKRNPSKAAVTAGTQANSSKVVSPTKDTPSLKPSVSNDRRPSYMRSTAAQKSRGRNETPGSRKVSSAFSRTNPPKPEISPKRNPKSPGSPMNLFTNDPEAATRYWLRYWVVFALVQSLGTFASMVPVFGSFVAQHPFVLYVCSELKLLFFIWLFAMEKVIGAVVVEQDSVMAKALPLALIHEHVVPILLEFEAVVAETVSRATWMSLVHSQAQRILDVLVMLKMLSETRKDWLLHVLEESRTLLVPSLSLFMPSFITSFGVAYVQFVVPSAKSGRAIKAAQKRSKFDFGQKDDAELLYLQYWVVHCLVSGLLAYFASLLWWIPFSTHATFLVWCHLSLPKSIVQSYDVLEAELKAFGMLPGESKVGFNETMTAHILQSLYSRLPSAADIELSGDGEDASRGDATETEGVPKNPKLGQALSVDSEQSSQEVSIRAPKLRGDSIDSLPQGSSEMEIDGSDDENTPPPDQVEGVVHNFRKSKPKKTAEDDEDNTAATSQDCAPEDSVVPTKDELTDGLRRSTRRRKVA